MLKRGASLVCLFAHFSPAQEVLLSNFRSEVVKLCFICVRLATISSKSFSFTSVRARIYLKSLLSSEKQLTIHHSHTSTEWLDKLLNWLKQAEQKDTFLLLYQSKRRLVHLSQSSKCIKCKHFVLFCCST